ncbi:MAG: hypothetical protein EXS08_10835 [Planctomycetes bacterium]|nr:hypothetical protein [Planctomycetota bacterium]
MNRTRSSLLALALGTLLLTAACAQSAAGGGSAAPTTAPKQAEEKRLLGKWRRPDGGYVLDIRAAAVDGILDVGYFNPNPIHVSQSTWERSGESDLAVFIELRDTGYPGATYRLQYRATDDTLAGAYTQPSVGETFDVEFARLP